MPKGLERTHREMRVNRRRLVDALAILAALLCAALIALPVFAAA